MRFLELLVLPLVILFRLLRRPFLLRARRRAAGKDGWVELELEGAVVDYRPAPEPLYRRLMPWREGPRLVTLIGFERLVHELKTDPRAKGLLLRFGDAALSWKSAAQIHQLLAELRAANKEVITWIAHGAANREYLAASGARQLWSLPAAIFAPVGVASSGLFFKETLDRLGVRFEVRAAGKYKSAPDAVTRVDRSEADREQTSAIVARLDSALSAAMARGRGITEAEAIAKIDAAPSSGARAVELGLVDALVYDEDVTRKLAPLTESKEPPELVDARAYLAKRRPPPVVQRRRKVVGIVEVHGSIVERGGPWGEAMGNAMATERAVVADLRAAGLSRQVGAVVLHVDSRGGSVIASDAILGAVRRLNEEKPVIACFGDVAASGGYYVACGARAIVASPLTITGSIGVFAMMPTWPELGARLGLHADVIKNRRHASLFDPWRTPSDEERAHGQAEVLGMYEAFLAHVAAARKQDRDWVHALAQGRVWMGEDAKERGLVDGLGGLKEAIERAKAEAKVRFDEDPKLIRAKKPLPRPDPPEEEDKKPPAALLEALWALPVAEATLIKEILSLLLSSPTERRAFAYDPSGLVG